LIREETLYSIKNGIKNHNDTLLQIRDLIIEEKVSNYPIFIFQSYRPLPIGRKVLEYREGDSHWEIKVTILEELFKNKIIEEDKVEHFRLQYKNYNDQFCILYLNDEEEMGFVYVPITFEELL